MSFPLLKVFTKNTWKLWLLFTGILLMYMIVLIFSFDQLVEMMNMAGDNPEILGITFPMSSRFDLLAGMYFDMLIFMFPMIFYIILANRLVSKAVDDNSMASYLSSSMSRRQYTVTAAFFLIISLVAMFFVVFAVGGAMLVIYESVNWLNWTNMVLTTLTCTLMIAGICFFFSTVMAANRTGQTLMIGIPVLFFLFMWLGEMPSLDFLHYLTPFGFVDSLAIAHGLENLWWLINLAFIAIATALFVASVLIFDKKQLSV